MDWPAILQVHSLNSPGRASTIPRSLSCFLKLLFLRINISIGIAFILSDSFFSYKPILGQEKIVGNQLSQNLFCFLVAFRFLNHQNQAFQKSLGNGFGI